MTRNELKMSSTRHSALMVLMIIVNCFHGASCECEKNYVVFCDDFADLQNYNTEYWREVVIGSTRTSTELLPLNETFFSYLYLVESLTVVRRINDVTLSQSGRHIPLKYLNLYGNDINVISDGAFAKLPQLVVLNLENNNVEDLGLSLFYPIVYRLVNMARNKIAVIKTGNFLNAKHIIQLFLQNNCISSIQVGALPSGLELLNLDYNNLGHFSKEMFQNLRSLKHLSLSHNKLNFIAEMPYLIQIRVLDLSFNAITSIFENFHAHDNLIKLDLSHNRLRKFSPTLAWKNKRAMAIMLDFNLLTDLDFSDVSNVTFPGIFIMTLYGNPWNCKCLPKIEAFMEKNDIIREQKCEIPFFGTGKTPVCIPHTTRCSQWNVDSMTYENFLKTIEASKEKLECGKELINL